MNIHIYIYICVSNFLYTMNHGQPRYKPTLPNDIGSPPSLTESLQIPPFFSFSPVALISEMHLCKHRWYRNSWDLPSGKLT